MIEMWCACGRNVFMAYPVPSDGICEEVNPDMKKLFDSVPLNEIKDMFLTVAFNLLETGGDVEEFVKGFELWLMCELAKGTKIPQNDVCQMFYVIGELYWRPHNFRDGIDMYKKHFDRKKFDEFTERIKPEDLEVFHWVDYAKHYGFKTFEEKIREKFRGFDKEFLETLRFIQEYLGPGGYFEVIGKDQDVPRKLRGYWMRVADPDYIIACVKEELEMKEDNFAE